MINQTGIQIDSQLEFSARLAITSFEEENQNIANHALDLLAHAALPVVFNSELLHLLRVNFLQGIPEDLKYDVEYSLILSSLFSLVDEELGLYEISPEIRNILLTRLSTNFGPERIVDVAHFIYQYASQKITWRKRGNLYLAQHLAALFYINSNEAKKWLEIAERQIGNGEGTEESWFIAVRKKLITPNPLLEVEAEHIELIKSIEKKFITPLSRRDQQVYKELNRSQRLELIEALRKIDSTPMLQLEYLKHISPIPIDETFTDQILRGFISQKPSELVPAAVTMGSYVEEVLTNELKHCLSFIYPVYNLKFSHDELKWPKGKIEEFTLGNINEMFSRINTLEKFNNLKIEFPPLFFEELNTLIVLRNHAAHGVLVKYLNDNFSLWFRRIVDMHEKAFYIFSTIQDILYRGDLLEQALQTALLNINFSQDDYQVKEEIISEIKLSNENIIKLITNSNEQSVNRFYAIIAEFKLLSADQHRFEIKARKVIQYFDNNEELITAHLTPTEQTRLEKLHGFLTKEVPADVFTNILAAILFELITDPNFGNIIMDIIKLIR